MSLRINNNISALNGHRNMVRNDARISKSLEKLSSGLRINRAADDAAGLIISEQMRAQITGLNQGISNTETAISMVQTAEGALDEMNSLLNKARQLALHAANEGANDANQLQADQAELNEIVLSITRIAENTQFGVKKVLDGTLAQQSDLTEAFATNANITSATGLDGSLSRIAAGDVTLNVTQAYVAAQATDTQASIESVLAGSEALFADSVVQADVTHTWTLSGDAIDGNAAATLAAGDEIDNTVEVTMTITDGNGTTFTASHTGADGDSSMQDLIDAMNTEIGAANGSVAFGADGQIVFTATDDGNLAGAAGNDFTISITEGTNEAVGDGATTGGLDAFDGVDAPADLAGDTVLDSGTTYTFAITDGTDTAFTVELEGDGTRDVDALIAALNLEADGQFTVSIGSDGEFTLAAVADGDYDGAAGNDFFLRLSASGTDADGDAATGGVDAGEVQNAEAELLDVDGNVIATLTVASDAANGYTVSNSSLGISIEMDAAAAGSTGSLGVVATAVDGDEGAVFQIGANRNQTVSVNIQSMLSTDLGKDPVDIDGVALVVDASLVSLDSLRTESALTSGLAQDALAIIDKAIDDVTNLRGDLGAVQANSLESNVSSLRVTLENLTAAESTIRDVDFAHESAIFTRNSIMIQASTAMLAQANQLPQNVLQLLG